MDDEFGAAYARHLSTSLSLTSLGGRTAQEALDAGVPPRDIWLAICVTQEVPESRWLGKNPRRRA